MVTSQEAARWLYSEYIFILAPTLLAGWVRTESERRVREDNKIWGLAKGWMDSIIITH